MADGTILTYTADKTVTGDGTKGSNFHEIQDFLGRRPGDYMLDPYYLRKGIAGKPYFWNVRKKKWQAVRVGDKFYFDDEGVPTQEKA